MQVLHLAYDDVAERDLFFLEADPGSVDALPETLGLPSPHFACLLVLDGLAISDAQVHRLAAKLLKNGAVYFCAWGPGCERVHDLIDDAILIFESDPTEDNVILTTWHDDESLEEALFFLFCASWPAADYIDRCGSALVIVSGSSEWAEVCRVALRNPRELVARVSVAPDGAV